MPSDGGRAPLNRRRDYARLLALATVIVLPTLALVVQLSRRNSPFVPQHVAELVVRIPQSGELLLDLSTLLEVPTKAYSRVTLRLPQAAHVLGMPSLHRSAPAPRCDAGQCRVELQNLTRAISDLSMRIDEPGRYELRVERSDGFRLRKDLLVLHAAR